MPSPNARRPSRPLPTSAELDILAVLWRLGPATVREIHEALSKDNGYTTTLKQMQLMTERAPADPPRARPLARVRGERAEGRDPAGNRGRAAETRVRRLGQQPGAGGAR